MTSDAFEKRLLELWMTTRIPLTRANLAYCTSAPRRKMEKWLDAMVADGVLDVDVSDDGDMAWTVKGAARSPRGPSTVAELDARQRLGDRAAAAGTAMVLARARDLMQIPRQGRPGTPLGRRPRAGDGRRG